MNLKISFFNKSVIKSDFKRFWWVSAISALIIFLTFTFSFLNYALEYENIRNISDTFLMQGFDSVLFALIIPVGLAALIFSYLNSSSAVSCMHGLPIKRSAFFYSHFLSGVIILTLPIIINAIVLMLFRLNPVIAESYQLSELFVWAGVYILYNLMVFTGSAAVGMLSGNSIAGIVFTYIFALLPVGAESFKNFFLEEQLYGYVPGNRAYLAEKIYINPVNLSESVSSIITYIVFTLVFIAAAFLLYRKRNLENNAEIVAFPKLRPVFIYGVAICAGAVGYTYLGGVLDSSNILLLIPFGVLGIVIAEMIVGKTLKPKKAIKPAIIFSIGIFVLQFAFQADITGFEKRIPEIGDIKRVEYNNGFYNYRESDYMEYGGKMVEVFYEETDLSLTSKEDIENVLSLHEELVTNRTNDKEWDFPAVIKYTLNNGKTIEREYYASYDIHKNFLEPIVESETVRKQYFPILNDYEKDIVYVSVGDRRINGELMEFYKNQPETDRIIEALKEDLKNTDYEQFARRKSNFTQINLKYTRPAKFADGTPVPEELLPDIHEYYYIRSDYKNTLAVLEELGFFENIPTVEDIEKIGVNYMDKQDGENTKPVSGVRQYTNNGDDYTFDKLVETAEDIKTVYEYISEDIYDSADYEDAVVYVMLKDGGLFEVNVDLDKAGLPEVLKK